MFRGSNETQSTFLIAEFQEVTKSYSYSIIWPLNMIDNKYEPLSTVAMK